MGETHGVDDAAQSLKDEHGRPVVVQVVALGRLDAHRHEGLGFRLRSCRHTSVNKLFDPKPGAFVMLYD